MSVTRPRLAARSRLDWPEAERLREAGATYAEIGRRFGVSRQAVHYALDEWVRERMKRANQEWRATHRPPKPRRSLEDRLLSHVRVADNGCWQWTGALSTSGYGKIAMDPRGTNEGAHRVAYRLFVGEIPEGKVLDHLCRNRACVNPDHLEPVTHHENILRGEGMAARYARRDRCEKGHEFAPENTGARSDGGRVCLTCAGQR